jgi:hypothetical protein
MGFTRPTKPPTTPSPPASPWRHEQKGRATIIAAPNSIWAWTFPKKPGLVSYATKAGVRLTGKSAIRFKFRIEGSAPTWVPYHPEQEGPPCKVRLYFQRNGDDMMGKAGTTEFYRWWGNAHVTPLALGSFDVTAPLVPPEWGSVLGKNGTVAGSKWTAALADVGRIGFTFGGASFAGHGVVLATGSANFMLEAFDVV